MKRIVLAAALLVACLTAGAETEYFVVLKFTQSSFTLNLWQHMKDAANAFSITLPTTRKFYDSVKVGQKLDSKFKTASFLISGTLGSREIRVERKFTKEVK